ncbi:hypothetical protein TI39_contig415g00033 [Zymoseptoria brevis]|uniref:Uncharacterized protein n=1 Tax=Zymoseptoria brevis TaxID=1047168 RepID=A0A0F4GLT7_9PEZI|nr:hypothetical protein TI39_contig415g00033 [Zymoseptoria brevis]
MRVHAMLACVLATTALAAHPDDKAELGKLQPLTAMPTVQSWCDRFYREGSRGWKGRTSLPFDWSPQDYRKASDLTHMNLDNVFGKPPRPGVAYTPCPSAVKTVGKICGYCKKKKSKPAVTRPCTTTTSKTTARGSTTAARTTSKTTMRISTTAARTTSKTTMRISTTAARSTTYSSFTTTPLTTMSMSTSTTTFITTFTTTSATTPTNTPTIASTTASFTSTANAAPTCSTFILQARENSQYFGVRGDGAITVNVAKESIAEAARYRFDGGIIRHDATGKTFYKEEGDPNIIFNYAEGNGGVLRQLTCSFAGDSELSCEDPVDSAINKIGTCADRGSTPFLYLFNPTAGTGCTALTFKAICDGSTSITTTATTASTTAITTAMTTAATSTTSTSTTEAAVPTPRTPINIITNPGFEDGFNGWTEVARSLGAYRNLPNPGLAQTTTYDADVPAVLSFWFRRDNGNGSCNLVTSFDGQVLENVSIDGVNEYTRKMFNVILGPSKTLQIQMVCSGLSDSIQDFAGMFLDDVSLLPSA